MGRGATLAEWRLRPAGPGEADRKPPPPAVPAPARLPAALTSKTSTCTTCRWTASPSAARLHAAAASTSTSTATAEVRRGPRVPMQPRSRALQRRAPARAVPLALMRLPVSPAPRVPQQHMPHLPAGPHSHLFSNLDHGWGARPFNSGGDSGRGAHSGEPAGLPTGTACGSASAICHFKLHASTGIQLCVAVLQTATTPCTRSCCILPGPLPCPPAGANNTFWNLRATRPAPHLLGLPDCDFGQVHLLCGSSAPAVWLECSPWGGGGGGG